MYYGDSFDATKPYAKITVKNTGVVVFGIVRHAGEVILVNYDSRVWESTIIPHTNESYFKNDTLFEFEDVKPAKDTSVSEGVEVEKEEVVPSEPTPVQETEVEVEEDLTDIPAVEVKEEKPVTPKPTPKTTNRRARSSK